MKVRNTSRLKSIIAQVLETDARRGFGLKNLGYLPRWVILLIDIMAIASSASVTFYLFKGIGLDYLKGEHYLLKCFFYFIVNVFFFWWFKTYAGIIRHSSFIDAVKIIFSQLAVLFTILIVNIIYTFIYKINLFVTTALLINVIFSFCFLFFL